MNILFISQNVKNINHPSQSGFIVFDIEDHRPYYADMQYTSWITVNSSLWKNDRSGFRVEIKYKYPITSSVYLNALYNYAGISADGKFLVFDVSKISSSLNINDVKIYSITVMDKYNPNCKSIIYTNSEDSGVLENKIKDHGLYAHIDYDCIDLTFKDPDDV